MVLKSESKSLSCQQNAILTPELCFSLKKVCPRCNFREIGCR